eukprot:TRINITY_DN1598_c0_g1_i1.p2 TRINITY_DN1598_c0_g1~~TRINITY_DN1598_c0_g1_i1.p2  ORF type:complete len:579 (+),score=156.48 TRINITY_DN1598_c0_g1_i1:79-1737(+)
MSVSWSELADFCVRFGLSDDDREMLNRVSPDDARAVLELEHKDPGQIRETVGELHSRFANWQQQQQGRGSPRSAREMAISDGYGAEGYNDREQEGALSAASCAARIREYIAANQLDLVAERALLGVDPDTADRIMAMELPPEVPGMRAADPSRVVLVRCKTIQFACTDPAKLRQVDEFCDRHSIDARGRQAVKELDELGIAKVLQLRFDKGSVPPTAVVMSRVKDRMRELVHMADDRERDRLAGRLTAAARGGGGGWSGFGGGGSSREARGDILATHEAPPPRRRRVYRGPNDPSPPRDDPGILGNAPPWRQDAPGGRYDERLLPPTAMPHVRPPPAYDDGHRRSPPRRKRSRSRSPPRRSRSPPGRWRAPPVPRHEYTDGAKAVEDPALREEIERFGQHHRLDNAAMEAMMDAHPELVRRVMESDISSSPNTSKMVSVRLRSLKFSCSDPELLQRADEFAARHQLDERATRAIKELDDQGILGVLALRFNCPGEGAPAIAVVMAHVRDAMREMNQRIQHPLKAIRANRQRERYEGGGAQPPNAPRRWKGPP